MRTIIKDNTSETMQSKDRCIKIKDKILYKQILSENRCTKICIGIYTKQIGSCLDNLVLAKQVPQFMKTLSTRISEKRVTFLTR